MVTKGLFESTWGLSREEWESYRSQMRELLVGIARAGGTITYGEISQLVFNGRFSARSVALSQMMSEVCVLEEELHPGIAFGSLVVRADSGIPGQGYFYDMRNERAYEIDVYNLESCRLLWEKEIALVWDCYDAPSSTSSRQEIIDFDL